MNTPAHLVLNLALVPNRRWAGCALAVLAGALLPDAMMFVFYGYQKFVAGIPESAIWRQAYFDPAWQALFDVFNSIPVILSLGLVGFWRRSLFLEALAASMLVHCLLDLPLHHDDGHRHFFPLSDWRFESPVSYWDPRYFGDVFAVVEITLVGVAMVVIWRSAKPRWVKAVAVLTASVYVGFLGFAMIYWGGMA